MAEIMPAPYKLVITSFRWNGVPERPITFDCLDDSMFAKFKETFLTTNSAFFGSDDFNLMSRLTDEINSSPGARDTGFKYYLDSWHRRCSGGTFCLVLKRGMIETVAEYKIRNGLASDNIFGMETPTSTMSDSGVDGFQ
ncbi:hypothetical protein TWF106_010416 [Orbilia oligospora]|uniref:Uncharacterized protein n=1 Tax=Orbilia oligospora TaxID=2813651 RepID=A0A7C8UF16_ORBOL|nr:hypothetical protein TWF106_010416 [Orbilia oligospora]